MGSVAHDDGRGLALARGASELDVTLSELDVAFAIIVVCVYELPNLRRFGESAVY